MPPKSHDSRSQTTVRGRTPASKPLNASTISSSAKARAPSNVSEKQPRTNSKPPVVSTSTSKPPPAQRTVTRSGSRPKVTKVESYTVKLGNSSSRAQPQPSTSNPPPPEPKPSVSSDVPPEKAPAGDPLQIAAQAYPWMYMTSTLEACFNNSEESALKFLHEKEKEVKAAESDVQEQQTRLDAQRAIEFYDELESDKFAKAAPAIMKSFHAHGDACAKAESEALELAMKGTTPDPEDEAPLQPYYDMLENLGTLILAPLGHSRLHPIPETAEQLHSDALNLESSILELASEFKEEGAADDGKEESEGSDLPWARSRLLGAINACLPVIRARISNLSMAQELIDSAQENVSISLRMESLGLE